MASTVSTREASASNTRLYLPEAPKPLSTARGPSGRHKRQLCLCVLLFEMLRPCQPCAAEDPLPRIERVFPLLACWSRCGSPTRSARVRMMAAPLPRARRVRGMTAPRIGSWSHWNIVARGPSFTTMEISCVWRPRPMERHGAGLSESEPLRPGWAGPAVMYEVGRYARTGTKRA